MEASDVALARLRDASTTAMNTLAGLRALERFARAGSPVAGDLARILPGLQRGLDKNLRTIETLARELAELTERKVMQ